MSPSSTAMAAGKPAGDEFLGWTVSAIRPQVHQRQDLVGAGGPYALKSTGQTAFHASDRRVFLLHCDPKVVVRIFGVSNCHGFVTQARWLA
jgi:hypothetical protein